MEKTCSKCKLIKNIDDFAYSYRYKNKRQSHCRVCSNEAGKKNYNENKERYYAVAKGRDVWLREQVNKIKDVPCMDCNNKFDPICMDFDHLPEFEKFMNISAMVKRRMAWSKIEKEIAKCEIVCSNCHRLRGKQRGDF